MCNITSCAFIRYEIYNSSCKLAESKLTLHTAGVENSMAYSHRLGSVTEISLFSLPQVKLTTVERAGPFQQLRPLSYFILEYFRPSGPFQSFQ
ncbi:hypothetical protein WN48_01577 [Eufriesea mexicana]|nr:hypothetical protein WN48_01577 [Eufriesea mexicana]